MAYQFKIIKLPLNGILYIEPNVKAKTNIPYPISKQSTMYFSPKYKVASEPYSKFIYQIKPEISEDWSDDIDMEINIQPTAGAGTCVSNNLGVTFISKNNISSKLNIENTEDRIRVTQVEYGNMVTVDGAPLEINKTYMATEWNNIYFVSPSPEVPGNIQQETIHSVIHYQTGDKNGWNTGCTFTLNKIYAAYLSEIRKIALSETKDAEGVQKIKGLYTFKKSFSVLGGVPNATITLLVSKTFPWAYAEFSTDDGIVELNQDITSISKYDDPKGLTVTLDDTGSLFAVISGTPLLEPNEENFGFNVQVEIISVNGEHESTVDDSKDTILLEFYSHPDYAIDFNVIYKLLFTSSSFATTSDISSPIDVTINSGTLEFFVNVSMYSNKGVPPFEYKIIGTDGKTSTISNTKYVNQFKISDLVGGAGGAVENYKFEVKVTDSNKILSKEYFEINLTEANVVIAPTNVSINFTGDPVYEGQSIEASITADNNPTSFRVENLPRGLILNTNTGNISGSVATKGTYTINIFASNSGGETSGTSWSLNILEPLGKAPVITSTGPYYAQLGDPFIYTTTLQDSEIGVTFSMSDYPSGWTVSTDGRLIHGIIGNNNSFTAIAQNAYGVDKEYITVFIQN